jgi:RHS repeat-associated protein
LNGNRLCKGESTAATHYTYTSGTNRLASSTGGEAASYSYNNNASTTNDGTHAYTYNQAGRLATVGSPPIATYTYDGDNRRAVKIASSTTTDYFYDPSGRLIQEYIPATGNGKDYIYVHDAPLARVDWSVTHQGGGTVVTNAPFYYHTDHLGTPIAMTDGSSAFVWRAEHVPFGGLWSNNVATVANNLRFPGQYFDQETGMHQNWFRDYAPKTGRYAEADPIGLQSAVDPYSYVDGSPVARIDPFGLFEVDSSCDLPSERLPEFQENFELIARAIPEAGKYLRDPVCRATLAKYPKVAACLERRFSGDEQGHSPLIKCQPNPDPKKEDCGQFTKKFFDVPDTIHLYPGDPQTCARFDPRYGIKQTLFHEAVHSCGPSDEEPMLQEIVRACTGRAL